MSVGIQNLPELTYIPRRDTPSSFFFNSNWVLTTFLSDFLNKSNSNIVTRNSISNKIEANRTLSMSMKVSFTNNLNSFSDLAITSAGYLSVPQVSLGTLYQKGYVVYDEFSKRLYKSKATLNFTGSLQGNENWEPLPLIGSTWALKKRPVLNLQFKGKNLNKKLSFTRASTATYRNSVGIIKTAAVNSPRIDYASNGDCLGLLIEEARTNVLTNSEDFSTTWGSSGSGVTLALNATKSPDGLTTADKIIPNTTLGAGNLGGARPVTANTKYTFSVFAKPSGYSRIGLRAYDGTAYIYSGTIDILNKTVISNNSGVFKIESYSDGWVRVSATGTTSASASSLDVIIESKNSTSLVQQEFIGDGVSGAFFWGAQLEIGGFATSYIPTAATSVTRAVDVCSYPYSSSGDSTFYVVADKIYDSPADKSNIISIKGEQSNTIIPGIDMDATSGASFPYGYILYGSNGFYSSSSAPVVQKNTRARFAVSYSSSAVLFNLNGFASNSGSVPVVEKTTLISLGSWPGGGFTLNGHISEILAWNSALTSEEINSLCTS